MQNKRRGGRTLYRVYRGYISAQKENIENPVIAEIAEKYQKTPAQVMLRWHIQRGVVVIPKSTHIERMEENFNVFDFTLSDEDMKTIAELDKKTSSFFSHQDPNMVEWFVKMVEERKKNSDSSKEKKNW